MLFLYKLLQVLQAERKQKVVFFVSPSLFSKHEISVLTFEMNVNCFDKKKSYALLKNYNRFI